jgi:hypothetical protein
MEALMKRKASLISATVAAVLAIASSSWAQTVFTQKAEFNVPEANQGIAADKHFFYAIDDATSSIEVWDAVTLKHIGSHSIGISLGSLTWLDLHDGSWVRHFRKL